MADRIVVEKCVREAVVCKKCGKEVRVGELTVVPVMCYARETVHTHLKCYKHWRERPIEYEETIVLRGVAEEKDVVAVRQWVERWNRKFVPKVPKKFLMKEVDTVCTPARRMLLEVFQYLSVGDIEAIAARVSKEWFHVTRDEEMWKRRYLLEFKPEETQAEVSYRKMFITATLESCWICNKVVTLQEVEMICPLRKRVLCQKCSRHPESRLEKLSTFCKERSISLSLAVRLNVTVFKHKGAKSIYTQEFFTKLVPYAEQRREKLIECLEREHPNELSDRLMEMIRRYDTKKLFLYGYGTSGSSAFAVFFGKDDTNEDLSKSVKEFIKKLMRP